jgi:hypothetical protein
MAVNLEISMTSATASLLLLAAFAVASNPGDGQTKPPAERVRLAFAPPKDGAYRIEYAKDETWGRDDLKGEQHVVWTMRDHVLAVSKKGRVLIEGAFQSASYRCGYVRDGKDGKESFQWTAEGGYSDDAGDAVERIGKKEIPAGLSLALDARGAAEKGAC